MAAVTRINPNDLNGPKVALSSQDQADILAGIGALAATPEAVTAQIEAADAGQRARMQAVVSGAWNSVYAAVLTAWPRQGSLAGKKLALVGDSTTLNLQNVAGNLAHFTGRYVTEPGSPLYGVTLQWFGSNGNSLNNFAANSPAGYGINDVIAAAPDGIEFCYGINDLRLQAHGWTYTTFRQKLIDTIGALRTGLPGVPINLRVPNSFLTTDTGAGSVVPNSWAQAACDILRASYRSLIGYWPDVTVTDPNETIFNPTCQASWPYMGDQLHPGNGPAGGYGKIIDMIAATWGLPAKMNQSLVDVARAAGELDEFTRYPLCVLDTTRYTLIASGPFVTQGSTFLRFSGDIATLGGYRPGDVVLQNNSAAFALPSGVSQTNVAGNIQLGGLGAGVPAYAQAAGTVAVYRRRYAAMAAAIPYVNSPASYPYQVRALVNAAGANYFRVITLLGEPIGPVFNLRSGDIVVHPTLGAVTALSSFSEVSNDTIQVNKTGDFTMPAGAFEVYLFGPSRNTNNPQLKFAMPGVLTSGVLRDVSASGGVIATAQAVLGTAGSTATTVAIARNGTTVLTLTFAASATTPTLAWAAGSQFCTLLGRSFTATVTAGTGAADLAISLGYA